MELLTAKTLVVILLALLRLFSGLVPLCFTKQLKRWTSVDNPNRQRVDITVSLCLSLGGGVLLATCFIHMIPEVRHSIETHSAHSSHHFPFTELLVCIGFFIVYIVEESVRHCLQTRRGAKSGSKSNHVEVPWTTKSRAEVTPLDSNSKPGTGGDHNNHSHHPHIHTLPPLGTSATCEHTSSEHIHSLRSFLVVLALSFHSVMEGKRDLALNLFCARRVFSGISLVFVTEKKLGGNSWLLYWFGRNSVYLNVKFDHHVSYPIDRLTSGLAAGTILYVTFFEVLDKERKRDSTPGLIKLAFVILGFCLMICLEVMGGHSHSDHSEISCNTTCNSTLLQP
ncbi:zinc transporter ZIP1-like [Diaphorina citri]|uniref:Zinc transporter ZIP1-like n=1 Tax=Diaphorina citri TaxID=121845 RepID=A0A3Q0IT91_DIACI|nr:zinc transporter ZIP1-like [Diaphorina citri]